MTRENAHEETPAQFKRLRRQEQGNARRAGIVTRENAHEETPFQFKRQRRQEQVKCKKSWAHDERKCSRGNSCPV